MLSSLVAYALAVAALRPVESMRRGAEAEAAAEPGRWLPLPPARDEVARLGETLNTMLTRLESALAREQRFVSDASHELRTPLAALRNEGPGFAPELVEHALEPFTRGDSTRPAWAPEPAWVSPSSTSSPAPTAAPHTRPTATAVPTPGSLPDHRERTRPAAVTTRR